MKQRHSKAITLVELVVAVILMMVVVAGLNSINVFSHFHIISASKVAKLQNEVSLGLDHMSKGLTQAVGNEVVSGADSVIDLRMSSPNQNWDRVSFRIDINGDGQGDLWACYRWTSTSVFSPVKNALRYCNSCVVSSCPVCADPILGWWIDETIVARNVTQFWATKPVDGTGRLNENYINVTLTACYNPAGSCGSRDNPSVTMNTSVRLPSVSTN